MKPELILHIGAHRTGTTTLQAALDAAREPLLAKGICVLTPPRPGKREQVTVRKIVSLAGSLRRPAGKLLVWYKRHNAREMLLDLIDRPSFENTGFDKIILSDEKMLGSIFSRNGQSIYPNSKSHLHALRKLLPLSVSEVHVTLRAYDSFIISSYVMRAVYGSKIKPFGALANRLLAISKGWNDVIDDIRAVFPEAKLVISEFEKDDFEQRLRALIDDPQNHLNIGAFIPPPLNRAPTREAIEHVLQLDKKPGNPDEIVARFADGKPFDPLSSDQKTNLQERYKSDISTIRNRSDVRFI